MGSASRTLRSNVGNAGARSAKSASALDASSHLFVAPVPGTARFPGPAGPRRAIRRSITPPAREGPSGPEPGRVRVELAACDDEEIGPARPTDRVCLRVSDTGVGIPPQKLDTVSDPFVQVRSELTREAGGSGLGLAISRDLARGMGGDLRVRSSEGVGSTFTVVLRRVVSATGEPVDRRASEERRVGEERRSGDVRRDDVRREGSTVPGPDAGT